MGVIKVNISKVYAKAQDRPSVSVYKKNERIRPNIQKLMDHLNSGNTKLMHEAKQTITLYSTDVVQIPEKTYNSVRLVLLNTIPKALKGIVKTNFCVSFVKAPHQLLKYHVIASGVRADRISQGMANAFGTPFMKSAKQKSNVKLYPFIRIFVSEKYQSNIHLLKSVLQKVKCKLPFRGFVKVQPNLDEYVKTETQKLTIKDRGLKKHLKKTRAFEQKTHESYKKVFSKRQSNF